MLKLKVLQVHVLDAALHHVFEYVLITSKVDLFHRFGSPKQFVELFHLFVSNTLNLSGK